MDRGGQPGRLPAFATTRTVTPEVEHPRRGPATTGPGSVVSRLPTTSRASPRHSSIPAGTAALTYWYRNGTVSAPFDAVLLVKVDGATVKTHTEGTTAEAAYSQQIVDLSAYADGASHTLSFEFDSNTGATTSSMVVDDVSIDLVTATPVVTGTEPASPNQSPFPQVRARPRKVRQSRCSPTTPARAPRSGPAYATTSRPSASRSQSRRMRRPRSTHGPARRVSWTRPARPRSSPTPTTTSRRTRRPGWPCRLPRRTRAPTRRSPARPRRGRREAVQDGGLLRDTGGDRYGSGVRIIGLLPGVGPNTTTTFKATATDAAGNTSACSTSSVTYVNDSTAPGLVTLGSVTPVSPNPSTNPVVKGTAEPGSTVNLYTTADCTGAPRRRGRRRPSLRPG